MKKNRAYLSLRLLLPAVCFGTFSGIKAQELIFDDSRLKNRGLDSALSTYFSSESRFTPGRQSIQLSVNGEEKGAMEVLFNQQGELCFDHNLLLQANLVPLQDNDTPCPDYRAQYPTTVINLQPNLGKVGLVVPQQAIQRGDDGTVALAERGGTSASLNYALQSTRNHYRGDQTSTAQGTLEAGLNVRNWLIRSQHMIVRDEGKFTSQRLYSYLQHTFPSFRRTAQLGEINAQQTLLGVPSLYGLQLVADSALFMQGSGITVRGIVQSSQGKVEIHQGGRRIDSVVMPNGPFTLENVAVTSLNMPLDVTITEEDGSITRFNIPASELQTYSGQPMEWAIAAGKVRDSGSSVESAPWLITVSKGWRLTSAAILNNSWLLSTRYQSTAADLGYSPMLGLSTNIQNTLSVDQYTQQQGLKSTLSVGVQTSENTSLFASISETTSGYREVLDALNHSDQYSQSSYSLGGRWKNDLLGNFSLSYFRSRPNNQSVMLSWNRGVQWRSRRKFNIFANWQRQSREDKQGARTEDLFYITLSIPLDKHSLSSSLRNSSTGTQSSLQMSGLLGEELAYSLSAQRDLTSGENSAGGTISRNLHYTYLNTFVNGSGNSYGYGLNLNGSMALNKEGLLFSSMPIQESYGVLSLSERMAGVKVDTPQGSVWTDYRGKALLPDLPAWQQSRLDLDAQSLPQNMDLQSGSNNFRIARGTVSFMHLGVSSTRRVLLTITMADNTLLPKGSTLMDEQGNYITSAVENGLVFINQAKGIGSLFVIDDNGRRVCQLQYQLPDSVPDNVVYEEVKGVCQ